METRGAKTHKEDSAMVKRILRPLITGVVAGALCCVLVLVVMAAIMAAKDIPKVAVTPMAVVAAAFGAFMGGVVAAKISKEKGLLYGAGCGLLLFLLVMIAGFAVLRDVRGTLLIVKLAVLVGCGAVGGIVGVNIKRR
jgi:putative membrane protein (TIGR04086 family)